MDSNSEKKIVLLRDYLMMMETLLPELCANPDPSSVLEASVYSIVYALKPTIMNSSSPETYYKIDGVLRKALP